MKRILSFILSLFILNGFVFSQEIQECGSSPKKSSTVKSAPKKSSSSSSTSSDLDSECMSILIDLCCDLMIENGIHVSFNDYPYADGGEFIVHDYNGSGTDKLCNFLLEDSVFYFPASNLMGNRTRFETTLFCFAGLNIENILYTNDLRNTDGRLLDFSDTQGILKLGAQIYCIQYNPISIGFNLDWLHMYNKIYFDTFYTEMIVRSYPVDPLHLEWRLGFSGMPKTNYTVDDTIPTELLTTSSVMVGIVLSRLEVFATWEYVQDGYQQMRSNGLGFGFRYNF